ncbi:hypothetical protein OIV83_006540, partial [Microbotryomycetes sp. JL201]
PHISTGSDVGAQAGPSQYVGASHTDESTVSTLILAGVVKTEIVGIKSSAGKVALDDAIQFQLCPRFAVDLPPSSLQCPARPCSDSGNKYDANAVKVTTGHGVQIGYIPRNVASRLGPTLDRHLIHCCAVYGQTKVPRGSDQSSLKLTITILYPPPVLSEATSSRPAELAQPTGTKFSVKIDQPMRMLALLDLDVKSLVFSQTTGLLDLIEPHLEAAGISFSRFDGSLTQKSRETTINRFQTSVDMQNYDPANPRVTPSIFSTKRDVRVFQIIVRDTIENKVLEVQAPKNEPVAQAFAGTQDGMSDVVQKKIKGLMI